jgi:acyl-CoA thioesterase
MGDLERDAQLRESEDELVGDVSPEWRLVGPSGGFVSALALRAALARSRFDRPVSYLCHYLNPAVEAPLRLRVQSQRGSRRLESLRVEASQEGRAVLTALVWAATPGDGTDHAAAEMPASGRPHDHRPVEELSPGWPPFPFWANFDYRPVVDRLHPLRTWLRFRPTATWSDPVLAALRLVVLADVFVYPAAQAVHNWAAPYWATSLDLAVSILDPGVDAEWLLVEAEAPASAGGLLGGHVRVWSEDGRLLADSVQQMLQLGAGPQGAEGTT